MIPVHDGFILVSVLYSSFRWKCVFKGRSVGLLDLEAQDFEKHLLLGEVVSLFVSSFPDFDREKLGLTLWFALETISEIAR